VKSGPWHGAESRGRSSWELCSSVALLATDWADGALTSRGEPLVGRARGGFRAAVVRVVRPAVPARLLSRWLGR